jgi:hypothetical protein
MDRANSRMVILLLRRIRKNLDPLEAYTETGSPLEIQRGFKEPAAQDDRGLTTPPDLA